MSVVSENYGRPVWTGCDLSQGEDISALAAVKGESLVAMAHLQPAAGAGEVERALEGIVRQVDRMAVRTGD